jgi:hypothetical protein
MGAAKLSDLAGQLETMTIEGALSEAQTLLNDVISEFHKLEEFVSKPDWIETAKEHAPKGQASDTALENIIDDKSCP